MVKWNKPLLEMRRQRDLLHGPPFKLLDVEVLLRHPTQSPSYRQCFPRPSATAWAKERPATDKRHFQRPQREEDPKLIIRLVGQVITMSLETVRIGEGLPELGLENRE